METYNLIQMISQITNQNSLTSLNYLNQVGYEIHKSLEEQDDEVADTITKYLLRIEHDIIKDNTVSDITLPVGLKKAIQEVNNVINEDITTTEDKVTPVDADRPQHYNELLDLFNRKKTLPKSKESKETMVEEILNILIPKSSAGSIKGRMLKDKHKLMEVYNMLGKIKVKEELSTQLVNRIDTYQEKKNKRNKV